MEYYTIAKGILLIQAVSGYFHSLNFRDMLNLFGTSLPATLKDVQIGGTCPHCGNSSRFSIGSTALGDVMKRGDICEIMISYSCDACMEVFPISWSIEAWTANSNPIVKNPQMVLPVKPKFEFDHVPDPVSKEINEALECISVEAYHGFTALIKRAVRAIAEDLGTDGAAKVKKQVDEILKLSELDEDWEEITEQLLPSANGAYDDLPEMDGESAPVLIALIQDVTYQLYTRPQRIREASPEKEKKAEPENVKRTVKISA